MSYKQYFLHSDNILTHVRGIHFKKMMTMKRYKHNKTVFSCHSNDRVYICINKFKNLFTIKSFVYVSEYPNICEYCDNMKTTFWPDWDECTTEGRSNKSLSWKQLNITISDNDKYCTLKAILVDIWHCIYKLILLRKQFNNPTSNVMEKSISQS